MRPFGRQSMVAVESVHVSRPSEGPWAHESARDCLVRRVERAVAGFSSDSSRTVVFAAWVDAHVGLYERCKPDQARTMMLLSLSGSAKEMLLGEKGSIFVPQAIRQSA